MIEAEVARRLVARWRRFAEELDHDENDDVAAGAKLAYERAADELQGLIEAATGE